MRKLSGVLLTGALTVLTGSAVFGATSPGATTATVSAVISITAPASIAFGAGVPGQTVSVLDSTVNVISNNAAGYTLSVQASDLTKTTNTIPLTALSFREGVTAYAPVVAAATDVLLATTSAETIATGTDHLIDAQLVMPFVEAGAYEGTFIFTASNI